MPTPLNVGSGKFVGGIQCQSLIKGINSHIPMLLSIMLHAIIELIHHLHQIQEGLIRVVVENFVHPHGSSLSQQRPYQHREFDRSPKTAVRILAD